MTIRFVLLDETSGATTTSGESLTPDKLGIAATLLELYLNRDVGAYWGIPGGAFVRPGSSPTDIEDGEWPFHLQGALNVQGAIAYHTVNGLGVPDLYDAITLSDTLFGPDGFLTALSHELAETVGDPGANVLCQDGQGKLYAQELCDADETANYSLEAGSAQGYVANFLLRPFFVSNAVGPYDFMTLRALHPSGERGPVAPFETVPSGGGNYQIVEDDPNDETQITARMMKFALGKVPESRVRFEGCIARRLIKKQHPASRAYRRGLRLTGEQLELGMRQLIGHRKAKGLPEAEL